MNKNLNLLIRTAISAALQDREAFIKKFSDLVSEWTDIEAETATKAGEKISTGLQALQNELQTESLLHRFSYSHDNDYQDLEEKISALSKQVEELKKLIEKEREK